MNAARDVHFAPEADDGQREHAERPGLLASLTDAERAELEERIEERRRERLAALLVMPMDGDHPF